MKENQKTKERLVCSECGAVLTETEAREHEGKILCPHCLDEFTALCTCCGRRVWYSEAETDGDTVLCQSCYDYSYTRCDGCGRIISNDNANYDDDDEYPYCDTCYERIRNSSIRCYNYKPEPIFYGRDKLYYGVEVEVDKGGEYRDNAQILLDTASRKRVIRTRLKRHNFGIFRFVIFARRQPCCIFRTKICSKFYSFQVTEF